MHHVISLVQPLCIGLLHCRLDSIDVAACNLEASLFHFSRFNPTMRKRNQFRPFAVKMKFNLKAHYPILEVPQAGIDGFTSGQMKGICWLGNRSLFVADINRGRLTEFR